MEEGPLAVAPFAVAINSHINSQKSCKRSGTCIVTIAEGFVLLSGAFPRKGFDLAAFLSDGHASPPGRRSKKFYARIPSLIV